MSWYWRSISDARGSRHEGARSQSRSVSAARDTDAGLGDHLARPRTNSDAATYQALGYLPKPALEHVVDYNVPVTRELEDAEIKRTSAWRV
jgi:hypothetical protein